MAKPKFLKSRVQKEIRRTFPKTDILSYKKFNSGLVSPTYKVRIKNPQKTIVVKIYRAKNHPLANTNENVSSYLLKEGLPVPEIYSGTLFKKQYVVIMSHLPGKNALDVYKTSSFIKKKRILENLGRLVRKVHTLNIPPQWIHHKHEIKNTREWIIWTKKRVKKYLAFTRCNLKNKYYLFLVRELEEFLAFLKKNLEFVPLHWDYHLDNVLIDSKGNISGLLDFDNAMKGDSLAELGQTKYWLRFKLKEEKSFKQFLKGYERKITEKERVLINGYCLLHLLAVTRSIWPRRRKYGWIIKEHEKMLDEMMEIKEKLRKVTTLRHFPYNGRNYYSY